MHSYRVRYPIKVAVWYVLLSYLLTDETSRLIRTENTNWTSPLPVNTVGQGTIQGNVARKGIDVFPSKSPVSNHWNGSQTRCEFEVPSRELLWSSSEADISTKECKISNQSTRTYTASSQVSAKDRKFVLLWERLSVLHKDSNSSCWA